MTLSILLLANAVAISTPNVLAYFVVIGGVWASALSFLLPGLLHFSDTRQVYALAGGSVCLKTQSCL